MNSGYEVQYDSEKNILTIIKQEKTDCLLYGDKISVTAIVGDNGAGKSTLLDAIRSALFDERSRGNKIKGFLLWESEGRLYLFLFMKKEPKVISPILCYSSLLPNDFNLIYYSDFLDIKYYLEEFDDGENNYTHIEAKPFAFQNRHAVQLNISTSYLLRENAKGVLDYFHGDIKRQINFYGSLNKMILPFLIPKSLSVKMEFLSIDIFDRVLDSSLQAYEYMGMGHHGEINTKAYVIGLLKMMERVYEKKTIINIEPLEAIQILQWDIWVTYIYNLLVMRKQKHVGNENYNEIDRILKNDISADISEDNFWDKLAEIYSSDGTKDSSFFMYLRFYHKTEQCLKHPKTGNFHVDFCIEENMMQLMIEMNPWRYLSVDLNKELSFDYLSDILINFPKAYMERKGWSGNWQIKTFMDFYECYARISYELDFLKFSWGMSSGENSMFNLFARLYDAMQKDKKDKIILLFDELDCCFHPQWQQEIIASLTKFLRSMYSEREFQIILTTHSPVLLSDIPKENVIFMRKEKVVNTKHEQTFAANIASLYYDSFFMEKGSIGEVARKSIAHFLDAISELEEEEREKGEMEENRVIRLADRFLHKQYLNGRKFAIGDSQRAITLLQKFIDSIGEDIWRYKMNESFHRYLKSDGKNEKEEILNELRELEQKEGRDFVKALWERWLKEEEL